MTPSSNSSKKAPFSVSAPSPRATTPQPAPQEELPPSTALLGQSRKLPLPLFIVAGLALAAFIPVPYQVGGETVLEWPEGARQQVRSPMPAIVEEFYVQPGDKVVVGQPLVKLSSRELNSEIASVRERLARAQEELQEARRSQVQAEANLVEVQAQAQAIQERASRLQSRLSDLSRNILPPDIQALTIQRDRVQVQLEKARNDWERAQELHEKGAISKDQLELSAQAYRILQRDLEAKGEEIRLVQQRLSDTTQDELGGANYQQARILAANLVVQSTDKIEAHRQTIATLEERLQELQQQQDNLVLVSNQAGTVLSNDLDLTIGRAVNPESDLLRIANLDYLTANIEIKQEDLRYVSIGQDVTFRSNSDKLTKVDAKVDSILPYAEPDQTQQRRVVLVRVSIPNPDGQLIPDSTGYAKIPSPPMPLYQRVRQETIKLLPSKFL